MRRFQYMELANILASDIKSGVLAPGEKLPTHRALAETHNVALATASRAFKTLQNMGLIVGEQGRGMFVRSPVLPQTLGVEQFQQSSNVDLVFNSPSDPQDGEILRAGLRWLSNRGDLTSLMQYQPHGGPTIDRRAFATYLSSRLGPIDPASLFITSGAQHGLSVAVFGFLKLGDIVATDTVTYPGFLSALALRDLTAAPVSSCDGSMDPAALEQLCTESSIRAVYLTPTVHNPLGSVMNEETRRAIVDVARRHDLLIFEDGAYDFLETSPPASFLTLAPERTIYIGGFSKVAATGLRVGWVIVPDHLSKRVSLTIRSTTWNTPAIMTSLMTHWIQDGTIANFENTRRMAGAAHQSICQTYLGDFDIQAHRNASFVWLTLPKHLRAEPLVAQLAEIGIAIASSEPFTVGSHKPNAIRLALGGISDEKLHVSLESIRQKLSDN